MKKNMNKIKVYEVKHGYNSLGYFENLDQATKFFGELVKGAGKQLVKVEKKGQVAYYWGAQEEFAIKISEVEIHNSKKEAEFAVFNGEGQEDED